MSPLRSKFISYLQLRGFTDATSRNYVQSSPEALEGQSARKYLDYLKNTSFIILNS